MLEAGESPRFVLRRMVIFASEDIGNADPQALQLAVSALQAFELMGMPEGVLPLTQAVTYLACAPKSNTAVTAYGAAKAAVHKHGALPVPDKLRNAPTRPDARSWAMGRNIAILTTLPATTCANQYLPEALANERFYRPSRSGRRGRDGRALGPLARRHQRSKTWLHRDISPRAMRAPLRRVRQCSNRAATPSMLQWPAMFAAFAAEPVLTGPFGGGFGMVAGPKLAPVAYDFFADIPGRGLPPALSVPELDFKGLEVSFGPTTQVFHGGRGAAAVPLLIQGLLQLHAEHGRLPLTAVVAPAIALAKEGVALSAQIAGIANILTPILTLTPDTAKLFAPQGHVLKAGDKFASADLAGLLHRAAAGQLDTDWEAVLKTFGPPHGRLTAADLQASQVHKNTPITVELGDYTIALNPPPSLGGLLVGFGLRLLANVPKAVWAQETDSVLHILGALAVSQAVRSQQVDPAARGGSSKLAPLVHSLLTDDYVNGWKGPMADVVRHGPPKDGFPVHNLGGTTHVSCIDDDGMACSITSSNGEGNGHVVPGAGVMINNFLGEEDINPAGFHRPFAPSGLRRRPMPAPTSPIRRCCSSRSCAGSSLSSTRRSGFLNASGSATRRPSISTPGATAPWSWPTPPCMSSSPMRTGWSSPAHGPSSSARTSPGGSIFATGATCRLMTAVCSSARRHAAW